MTQPTGEQWARARMEIEEERDQWVAMVNRSRKDHEQRVAALEKLSAEKARADSAERAKAKSVETTNNIAPLESVDVDLVNRVREAAWHVIGRAAGHSKGVRYTDKDMAELRIVLVELDAELGME